MRKSRAAKFLSIPKRREGRESHPAARETCLPAARPCCAKSLLRQNRRAVRRAAARTKVCRRTARKNAAQMDTKRAQTQQKLTKTQEKFRIFFHLRPLYTFFSYISRK